MGSKLKRLSEGGIIQLILTSLLFCGHSMGISRLYGDETSPTALCLINLDCVDVFTARDLLSRLLRLLPVHMA